MAEVLEEKPLPAEGKVIFAGIMKPNESHEDTPNSQKTEKTLPSLASEESDEGVDIPHFLQPLLGMNFMPFVQSVGSRESKSESSPEPSPKGAVLEPKKIAIACGTDEDEPIEEQKVEDDLDGYTKEYSEIAQAAKRKKKKKKLLRLIRKSLRGKNKSSSQSPEEDFGPSEDVNISMSTCESFSLQSLDNCDDDSVLTSDFLNSSNLDTSLDYSVASTTSKKSTGMRIFKRKGKNSKKVSAKNEASAASHPSSRPGAQGTLKWLKTQQGSLQNHQSEMNQVQSEMLSLQQKSNGIQKRMLAVTDEIANLQSALQMAEINLRNELNDFEAAKTEMAHLEMSAEKAAKAVLESFKAIQNGPPEFQTTKPSTPSLAADAAFAPTPKIGNSESTRKETSFQEPQSEPKEVIKSDAFIRTHDLNMDRKNTSDNPGFHYVDDSLKEIVENLAKLGLDNVTDESERFKATRDTKKTISKYEAKGIATNSVQGKDVLVWMGDCGHKNHGSKWPVVKARGLVETSPKELTELLLDSSRVKDYNDMSQGRDDVVIFQQDLTTSAEESEYGLPGAIKVLRSRNKPKLLPKAIEITSLMYAKPLEDSPGSYLVVNRTIFDDAKGTLKNNKEIISSEMLLGVNYIRPANDSNTVSEFNSITHIFPPGVPEFLAKKVAPSSAVNMIKDIQKLFD
ncbi:MAG: hypothetical protein SGBAC_007680 [Bacillariaceae sp.]